MKRKNLLDSFAVLAWLQDEKGAQMVEDLLYEAKKTKNPLLINLINLGEVYYQCIRKADRSYADGILKKLRLLPLEIAACTYDLVIEASAIKALYPISFADCFAVATAKMEDAVIVTGDPDFKKVEGIVRINWI